VQPNIDDQVIDFYETLFTRMFIDPLAGEIEGTRRLRAVQRALGELADASSQSLARFLVNENVPADVVPEVLGAYQPIAEHLHLADVGNPNVSPESLAVEVLKELAYPAPLDNETGRAVFRVGLHLIVQVLTLVGPLVNEWRRQKFGTGFELIGRVAVKINRMSETLDSVSLSHGTATQEANDENFELNYRDYLIQRFYRIEAGTLKMAVNLGVDLRELFVMPRVAVRPIRPEKGEDDACELLDLAAMRALLQRRREDDATDAEADGERSDTPDALTQVRTSERTVIVGPPGAGKSTFVEWLQLQLAGAEIEWAINGYPAIPLLLRVRQLDVHNLPRGRDLIECATGSEDRARLMPEGWIERQMKAGRVLFVLDGLDETDPADRDQHVLPWLKELCRPENSRGCRFLVTSRPVGYPSGALADLEFVECDLLDFQPDQIAEYTTHWCTALHLAQQEPEGEARRKGKAEGEQFVSSFREHPYIPDLARNPLMLSAICLVNYFEKGKLPEDRALLYKLCVEGLLHNWDQRRGIHSEYGLTEKLHACCETAIAMQADDRAEYEREKVLAVFRSTLKGEERAERLLEHIRYRSGVLLERRAGVFAFAHLTFQEYLAAVAIVEGNVRGVDAARLLREHADARWPEVAALYCGAAPAAMARDMIMELLQLPDSAARVLVDAYFASASKLTQDGELQDRVIEHVCGLETRIIGEPGLDGFRAERVGPIANRYVLSLAGADTFDHASFHWLLRNPAHVDSDAIGRELHRRGAADLSGGCALNVLFHVAAPDHRVGELVRQCPGYYWLPWGAPSSSNASLALEALHHLMGRVGGDWGRGRIGVFLQFMEWFTDRSPEAMRGSVPPALFLSLLEKPELLELIRQPVVSRLRETLTYLAGAYDVDDWAKDMSARVVELIDRRL